MLNRPNDVYRIPCQGCKVAYVGETSRPLGKRDKKHCRVLRLGNDDDLAVAKQYGHCQSNCFVLSCLGKRQSIYIITEPHAMDLIPGYPLPSVWQLVISKLRENLLTTKIPEDSGLLLYFMCIPLLTPVVVVCACSCA